MLRVCTEKELGPPEAVWKKQHDQESPGLLGSRRREPQAYLGQRIQGNKAGLRAWDTKPPVGGGGGGGGARRKEGGHDILHGTTGLQGKEVQTGQRKNIEATWSRASDNKEEKETRIF